MTDKIFDNNQVSVAGEVVSEFEFSHEVFGEGFYCLHIQVGRLSESFDVIPLMISERLMDVKADYRGKYIEVLGQFRSYNRHEANRNRLVIADLLVAVNRPYGKSDYIPCICWGRNARFAEKFQVGEHIQLWGRIQSREYQKKISENEVERRVAYEVSVSKLECLEEENVRVQEGELFPCE